MRSGTCRIFRRLLVTFELWLLLIITLLAGAMSPGPSVALVIRTAIVHGRRSGVVVALAHGVGITAYAVAVVLGLAAVIQSSSSLNTGLQIGGAVFLFYLGYRMFSGGIQAIRKGDGVVKEAPAERDHESVTPWQHALNGFLIVFLNPKVVLFFVAIFSQFLTPDQSITTQLMAASMAGGIDAAWYALVAFCVSNHRLAGLLGSVSPMIDVTFGALFMVFAVFVLLSL